MLESRVTRAPAKMWPRASSGTMQRRVEPLTRERLRELAAQDDVEVYEHTYDVQFEPFPADRVRGCVRKLVHIGRSSANAAEAKEKALKDAELAAFSGLYQTMFAKLCDPVVASNASHVATVYALIDTQAAMARGALTADEARGRASEVALAGLLRQSEEAPKPPSAVVEELD